MNPILLKFQKEGVVTVGTSDPTQTINLQDPIGYPTEVSVNLQTREITLTIYSEDGLNAVSRVYILPMDNQSIMSFLNFFANDVRRIARDSFTEFQGLTELPPQL
jgi:hypothetical protein